MPDSPAPVTGHTPDSPAQTTGESQQPRSTSSSQKGGIAIVNVNNRIKLLFGEEYGISVYSHQGAGTDVLITLPLKRV